MSAPTPIQFTPREQYIVSYFRDPAWTKIRSFSGYDLAFATSSLFMLWKFYSSAHAEPVYSYVAYSLLLGRLFYLVTEGAKFAEEYRNILLKYEARIAEYEEQLKAQAQAKE
jgi:hypothetical protein